MELKVKRMSSDLIIKLWTLVVVQDGRIGAAGEE